MANDRKCQHCRSAFAYGRFRVTMNPKAVRKPLGERGAHGPLEVYMDLCADCGFGLTRVRVSRTAQIPEERTNFHGGKYVEIADIRWSEYPYAACVCVEPYTITFALNKEYEDAKERDYQRLLAEKRARGEITRDPNARGEPGTVLVTQAPSRRGGQQQSSSLPAVVASTPSNGVHVHESQVMAPNAAAVSGLRSPSPRHRGG